MKQKTFVQFKQEKAGEKQNILIINSSRLFELATTDVEKRQQQIMLCITERQDWLTYFILLNKNQFLNKYQISVIDWTEVHKMESVHLNSAQVLKLSF